MNEPATSRSPVSAAQWQTRTAAIAWVWAWYAAVAFVAAWPVASLLRASSGGDAGGEAMLLQPGSHYLLSWLAVEEHGVATALSTLVVVMAIGLLFGLVPMAFLLLAVAPEDASGLRSAPTTGSALASFGSLTTLLVVVTAAQALGVGAAVGTFEGVSALTHASLGEARSEQLGIALALPLAAVVVIAGVVHDLARAYVVCRGRGAMRGLSDALMAFLSQPGWLCGAWAWRGALSWALVLAAAALLPDTSRTDVSGWIAVTAVHQLVALGHAALRASWLGKAVAAALAAP